MADMTHDFFADTPYGRLALCKLAEKHSLSPNFRLFMAEWLGDSRDVMRVRGAEFRHAKRGKYKDKLSILVPGTTLEIYMTATEIEAFEDAENQH